MVQLVMARHGPARHVRHGFSWSCPSWLQLVVSVLASRLLVHGSEADALQGSEADALQGSEADAL